MVYSYISDMSMMQRSHMTDGLPKWAENEQMYNCDGAWKFVAKGFFIKKILEIFK